MFKLNTRASGNFKIYTEDNYGNLELLTETKNLITDTGLHSISAQTWAEAFTHVSLGGGTTAPTPADTSLESEIFAPSNVYPANPASYTLASFDPSTGLTYRLGRSFKVDNTTGSTQILNEVGTSNGSAFFSRAVLPDPVTVLHNRFIYVIYELRLEVSTTPAIVTNFLAETDTAGPAYQFPTNKLGIFNNGFAKILVDGSVTGKNFAAGEAILEPSTTTMYLYKLTTSSSSGNITYFDAKRAAFEADPLISTNTAGTGDPTYARFGRLSSELYDEYLGVYDGTFTRARHIIVAPTGSTENIHGFVLSTKTATGVTVPTDLDGHGIHCMFDTASGPWVRPADSFVKIYFEHNWMR